LILPFLKEVDPATKANSWWNTSGSSGSSWGNSYGSSSFYGEKNCGRCGRVVSSSSRAGQNCPYCGAYWGAESEKRKY
jgi:ssDNA-binding Zn-finger/Zn-ribbon topoisomerase 1